MPTVYLSLGSNIGNRRRNIEKALMQLEKNKIFKITISSFYETEAVGPAQRNFYNIAGKFKTEFSPLDLLKTLKQIEKFLGRTKTYRWGPRVIDIDILFYGKKIFKTKKLTVPHKEILNRAFVLVPMNEICPSFVHPEIKKQIKTLCNNLISEKQIKYIEKI